MILFRKRQCCQNLKTAACNTTFIGCGIFDEYHTFVFEDSSCIRSTEQVGSLDNERKPGSTIFFKHFMHIVYLDTLRPSSTWHKEISSEVLPQMIEIPELKATFKPRRLAMSHFCRQREPCIHQHPISPH